MKPILRTILLLIESILVSSIVAAGLLFLAMMIAGWAANEPSDGAMFMTGMCGLFFVPVVFIAIVPVYFEFAVMRSTMRRAIVLLVCGFVAWALIAWIRDFVG